jgi:ketosteroid isomerase-like protein
MAEDAVALVQRLYAAFGAGDIPAVLEGLHPEVDWRVNGRRDHHPGFGAWPGRDGAAGFFQTIADSLDFTEFRPEQFYPAADKVFVTGRYAMLDKSTGKPAASEWVHVFTVKDGQVTGFREFTDTASIAAARA